jgi:CheY-like chemotaxis protein
MNGSILVVDDDKAILEFVSLALQDEGYKVSTAYNGADALQAIEKHQPDLVLLDMAMPVMDGVAFLKAYCGDSCDHAPVITLSAHANFPSELHCSCDFIAKPFDLNLLLERVEQYMKHQAPPRH